jgi:transcriptional regulator with XRE-family HTH domain
MSRLAPEDRPADTPPALGALPRLARNQREARGLSLRAAAEEIGMSFNSLSRFERGELPDVTALLAILRWLGFPLEWLDDDPGYVPAGERWAHWRGWHDCAEAHRTAVHQLAPAVPIRATAEQPKEVIN